MTAMPCHAIWKAVTVTMHSKLKRHNCPLSSIQCHSLTPSPSGTFIHKYSIRARSSCVVLRIDLMFDQACKNPAISPGKKGRERERINKQTNNLTGFRRQGQKNQLSPLFLLHFTFFPSFLGRKFKAQGLHTKQEGKKPTCLQFEAVYQR